MDSPYRDIMGRSHQRKTIRLRNEVYQKMGQPFSITICTYNKTALSNKFRELIFQSVIEGDLINKSDLMAVCVMPDHVHLLLASAEENLINLIGRWKSYTTHLIQVRERIGRLWQRSFYDHGLRKDENLVKVAEYITSNPVRRGLLKNWKDYPYTWHKWI